MFLILFDLMKVWRFSQKQNLNFVSRQAFASFKYGFFQVWGKCLLQSFPTPIGVTVLECPAILFGHICFSCLADVIAISCYCGRCWTTCFVICLIELTCWQMLLPYITCDRCYCHFCYCLVTDVIVTCCLSMWLMLLSPCICVIIGRCYAMWY